jgi:membrane protein
VANILLEAWPTQVANPIAAEIHNVLTAARGDLLTIGALLAVYFSSSGVESLRIGLNRAYSVGEQRRWYWLRLESIGYVLVGALGMLVMAFLIVLAPFAFLTALRYAPALEPLWPTLNVIRYGVTAGVLIIALFIAHKWLPAGHRRLLDILPGIGATLILWLFAGKAFGDYLAQFANNYVSTYAGLASVMVALVFLYVIASIFIYGGELNATIMELRKERRRMKSETR